MPKLKPRITYSLLHGDFSIYLESLEDMSIDMMLIDLPYGTTVAKWDTPIDLSSMWAQLKRVRKPGCPIIMFSQAPFNAQLMMSNMEEFRYEWIWEKAQSTGHLNANRCPMKAHENILVFYDKLGTYNPQITDGHERKVVSRKQRNSTRSGEIYGKCDNATDYDSTQRYPRDIIQFKKDVQKRAFHGTQKPLALCEYLIKTYSNPGDTVLDITCGSGTTLVAAKNLGRFGIGIEKDERYYNLAKMRLENDWDNNPPTKETINKIRDEIRENR